jgi:O-antigen ligase
VLMTVLSALIFIALYSLFQHRAAPNLIFGMERYTTYWKADRLGGTYQCPNHIAHLFQMWLPFCFVLLFVKRLPLFWRITCAYSIPLFMLLIYQTLSRAGILGSLAALSVTALLLILYKSRKWFLIAAVAVPLLAAGALGGLWTFSDAFRGRMMPVLRFVQHHTSGADIEDEFKDFRPQTWADSMVMIADKPFFGHGPGNYDQVFPEYRQRVRAVRVITVHPHNEYVELLSEYGAVGGLLALLAVSSAVIVLLRLSLRSSYPQHAFPAIALIGALAGTAVHGFFDFELRIFPNALMLALLAGCAAGPLSAHRADSTSGNNVACALRAHSLTRWVWALCLLAATLWSLPVMTSAWLRARGDRLVEKQQMPRAERLYQTAASIDRQNWAAYLGMGVIYNQYRFYELDPAEKIEWALRAYDAFSTAYRHDTKKEEIVFGLGQANLALGNREEGLEYLRQAANYRRFNDFYWRKLGIELRKAGLYEEALEVFKYAAKLNRYNPTVKRNIQWLEERGAGESMGVGE